MLSRKRLARSGGFEFGMDDLDEHDDVQNVYSNLNVTNEMMS